MVALDGMLDAPTVLVVLTTRTATLDMARFYRGRSELLRAVRGRWEGAEYCSIVEFTTGYGPRSGGQRRPHWNYLLKGVPADAIEELAELVAQHWCGRVDAEPWAQHVGRVYDVGGLTRYLALHFLKESQRPPSGFRGQRVNASLGYFAGRTRAEMRVEAQRSLKSKRALWRALQAGLDGQAAEDAAQAELAAAELVEWELVHVLRSPGGLIRGARVVERTEVRR